MPPAESALEVGYPVTGVIFVRANDMSSQLSMVQAHLVAASGEFVGTFLFLYFAYAGHLMAARQAGTSALAGGPSSETVVFVALIYSFSLLVNVWAFYRISGGLFNPAVRPIPSPSSTSVCLAVGVCADAAKVTLGLCAGGQLSWSRAAFLVPAQLIASLCAGGLVSAMFGGAGGSIALANTLLTPGVSAAQGVFAEMFMTAQLVFVVLMLAAEKSRDTFLAPIGIGLALLVAELPGKFVTNEVSGHMLTRSLRRRLLHRRLAKPSP